MTAITTTPDYEVADIGLAAYGRKEIRLAEHEMPGLMATRAEFADAQPLKGARVTGSLHMTIQTAVLIETLVALGAEVRWASCNMMIGGKVCVVLGYGDVGKGCADSLRGQGGRVIVTEIDPICALQAAMEGYQVARLEDVVETADIFITATGNKDVITASDMERMKHQAIVGNIGHFDNEIDIAGLTKLDGIERIEIKPQVHEWHFADGHTIIVLSEGRLHLDALGARLTELTPQQAAYIDVPVEGPYKSGHYRY